MATAQQTVNARNYNLQATVDAWVGESSKRCDAIMRASVQDLIEEAQRPVAKGGRMRVDTGFLRASGTMSFSGMPTGTGRPTSREGAYTWKDPSAELLTAEAGATIYFGWTANYAIYREAYDGFLISAIQQWQEIVTKHVRRLNARSAFRTGQSLPTGE